MAVDGAFGPDVTCFQTLQHTEDGRAWLAVLPGLVAEYEARWCVTTAAPYLGGMSGWAAPATRADGSPAVLKLAFPHAEARGEAAGLRFWDGMGAVRVLEADEPAFALLLERADPGVALRHVPGLDERGRLEIAAETAQQLWSRVPSEELLVRIDRLEDHTVALAELLVDRWRRLGRPAERGLVTTAAELLTGLPRTASRDVVVHGDLNPGNILSARRQPWLAIDPKPMIGDPTFDPSPILLQVDVFAAFELSEAADVLARRHAGFGDSVGESGERLLLWSFARTVESAYWEFSRGQDAYAHIELARARVLADAAGI